MGDLSPGGGGEPGGVLPVVLIQDDIAYKFLRTITVATITSSIGYPILLKLVQNNPRLTPHSLRHTHTSLLAQARATLEEIMDSVRSL